MLDVSGDQVTIQRSDGRRFTLAVSALFRGRSGLSSQSYETACGLRHGRRLARLPWPRRHGRIHSEGTAAGMGREQQCGLEDSAAWLGGVEPDHFWRSHLFDVLHRVLSPGRAREAAWTSSSGTSSPSAATTERSSGIKPYRRNCRRRRASGTTVLRPTRPPPTRIGFTFSSGRPGCLLLTTRAGNSGKPTSVRRPVAGALPHRLCFTRTW